MVAFGELREVHRADKQRRDVTGIQGPYFLGVTDLAEFIWVVIAPDWPVRCLVNCSPRELGASR